MLQIVKNSLHLIGSFLLRFNPSKPPLWKIDNICVIVWGGIGDGILFLPAIKAIKDKFKGKKIYSIIQRKELYVLYKDFSDVIYKDGFENADLKGFFRIFLSLKKIKPDIVISNAPNPEFLSGLIPYLAGAKIRLGSRETGRGFFLNMQLTNSSSHDIDRNIELLKQLGIIVKDKFIKFNIKKYRFNRDCFKICIHPGSGKGMYYKRWNKENFLRLINQLIDNFCIILTGTNEEKEEIEYIIDNIKKIDNFLGFIRTDNLKELISLLKGVDLIITNDSLISHLSSMLKKPVIAIFGPSDEKRYGPFSNNSFVVKTEIECRPCNRKQMPRCKDIKCLNRIKVSEVYEKAISLYNILHTH